MLDSEELSAAKYKARRAYKRKLWIRVLLSGVFFPVVGSIVATVFIGFLKHTTKKNEPSSISIAVIATIAWIALFMFSDFIAFIVSLLFPQNVEKLNNGFVKGLEVFTVLCAFLIMINSIFRLPKNISILADRKEIAMRNAELANPQTHLTLVDCSKDKLHDLEKDDAQQSERENQIIDDCHFVINMEILRLVLRHIKTVVTKYEQAIYSDDYGNVELDEASKVVDYFINKTVRNGLAYAALPPPISREDYTQVLSIFLNDLAYLDGKRDLIEKLININGNKSFEDALSAIAGSHAACMIGASDETLLFLLGDDWQSYSSSACAMTDDDFNNHEQLQNYEQLQAAQNFIMNSLVPSQDLLNLRKWFCERHEYKATLDDIVTGQEFELFCKKRLQELGWDVKTTRATGDFGADFWICWCDS